MGRSRRGFLILAILAFGVLARLAAVAQEAELEPGGELEPAAPAELRDAATPETEDLGELDRDVIDATADVAGAAAELASPPAWPVADDTPPDLGPYQVTIYSDGQALVQRRQQVSLHAGDNDLEIDGIPTLLAADSVGLRALDPAVGLRIIEQSGGSVATSDGLLRAAVGGPIEIRSDGRQVVEGTLLAVEEGGLVVSSGTGVHLVPTGAEVVLPATELAAGLRWRARAEQAGDTEIEVSYLTGGLSWAADYALTLRDSDRLVGFDAFVRLGNESGADLSGVGVLFVDGASPEAAQPAAAPPRRYFVPKPVDLPHGTAKRYPVAQVPAARSMVRYVATLGPGGLQGLRLAAELKNDAASGLGMALPPGPVRLYAPDRTGRLQLVGRQDLLGAAVDEPLTFDLGPADDVSLQVETATPENAPVRRRVRLRNLRTEELVVRLVERRPGTWRIGDSSVTFNPVKDGAAVAEVVVPANATAEVRYQVVLEPAAAPQG